MSYKKNKAWICPELAQPRWHILNVNQESDLQRLEEEIDKLRDSSITQEEHMEEIKEFKKLIKEKDNEIKRLEEKLISERKFAKEKEEYNESRLRKQIEYEMKTTKKTFDYNYFGRFNCCWFYMVYI